MRPFSVILLAAGGSSRLGRPKQLVEIGGVPLIRRAIDVAVAAGPQEVIVVLGAQARAIEPHVPRHETVRVSIVINKGWQEGMGGSIRAGVREVDPSSGAAVLMLCDQPRVDAALLSRLADAVDSPDGISATSYEGRAGAPCAFGRGVFPELLELQGDRGARDLIRDPARTVSLIVFEPASQDLDTDEDAVRAQEAMTNS